MFGRVCGLMCWAGKKRLCTLLRITGDCPPTYSLFRKKSHSHAHGKHISRECINSHTHAHTHTHNGTRFTSKNRAWSARSGPRGTFGNTQFSHIFRRKIARKSVPPSRGSVRRTVFTPTRPSRGRILAHFTPNFLYLGEMCHNSFGTLPGRERTKARQSAQHFLTAAMERFCRTRGREKDGAGRHANAPSISGRRLRWRFGR